MTLASWWPSIAEVLVLLVSAPAAVAGDPPMAIGLPGCNTTCGNVSVPYPFGMGPPRCYYSPGFKLTCEQYGRSKPPRLLLGNGRSDTFEVVDISLKNTTMRVVSHGIHSINMSGGWSLGDTLGSRLPYFLKPGHNLFILAGCDVQATLLSNGSIVSGCASFCTNQVQYMRGPLSPCTNIGCCQTSITTGSTSYGVELQRLNHSQPMPQYNLAIIAEVGWLTSASSDPVSNGWLMDFAYNYGGMPRWMADHLRVPVILQWTVAHGAALNASGLACPDDAARNICKSTNSTCRTEDRPYFGIFLGYSCRCKEGYQGNPYLTAGCKDIKECGQKEKYGCFGDCEELPGSFRCRCPKGTHGNYNVPGGCVKTADTNTGW